MDNHFNPAREHPFTLRYLRAVNAAIKRHKDGDICMAEFRDDLAMLRVEHNFGIIPANWMRL